MQPGRPEDRAMIFDEVSMERSKSFVNSLQELKNLRPQLYSAAVYCEKSYLHNEQKQLVLDNLKDYAVRALVNAVDHLGTVAYKLTDLFEQQTIDVSTVELKISCLSQKILTCNFHTNKEGLRQHQMLATSTRHHKHYVLPNSVGRRVESGSKLQKDDNLVHLHAKHDPHTPGWLEDVSGSKSLFWHLASETNSARNTTEGTLGVGDFKASKITSDVFHLLEADTTPEPLSSQLRTSSRSQTFEFFPHPFVGKETMDVSRPTSAMKPIENTKRIDIYRPHRSKSMLSAFFAKNKTFKPKRIPVS